MTQANKTDVLNVRMAHDLKKDAGVILNQLGLSSSEAVRLFYKQIVHHRGLPFPVRLPNDETIAAMGELSSGKGKSYSSDEELFEDLGI